MDFDGNTDISGTLDVSGASARSLYTDSNANIVCVGNRASLPGVATSGLSGHRLVVTDQTLGLSAPYNVFPTGSTSAPTGKSAYPLRIDQSHTDVSYCMIFQKKVKI